MRAALILLAATAVLTGCGSGGGETGTTPRMPASGATRPSPTAALPPGAVAPAETHEEDGAAAIEASPGSPASGPSASGELPEDDRAAIAAAVAAYLGALDRRDSRGVCGLMVPEALSRGGLAGRGRECASRLAASIGKAPRSGGPAWRRTTLVETKVERLSDERARVSATVTHRFSDRKYVSVEDDVVYLERAGARWLLAKPSATLYRALGYESPPLRAFRPPPGW
jgi:hypothetical protein